MAEMSTAFTTGAKHDFDVRRRNVPDAGRTIGGLTPGAIDDDEKKTASEVWPSIHFTLKQRRNKKWLYTAMYADGIRI